MEWDAPRVAERHSSFRLAEIVYVFIALLGVIHAVKARRLKTLACCVLAGLANDVFFGYLPISQNFYHSSASAMITDKLPVYISVFYVGWIYVPVTLVDDYLGTTLVETFGGTTRRASLVAALSAAYYFPWDAVGARLLWWTWHDSDFLMQDRWLLVPYQSSVWVLIFTGVLSLVMSRSGRNPIVCALACVPLQLAVIPLFNSFVTMSFPIAKRMYLLWSFACFRPLTRAQKRRRCIWSLC